MAVITILVSIKDSKNKVSTTEVNVPDALTLVQVTAFATALVPLINSLITGQIVRVGLAVELTLPGGIRTAPISGSDVEEGAKFVFRTQNNFFTSSRIATFDETKIASNSRLVNTADAAVAAFIVAMVLGISSATPVDKRGEDIASLESALESFQTSRAS